MRRISTPTAAQDKFGPGKHGFRNGDPANAVLATRLQAEWFDALQEEVANAVEASGESLDPANNGQLSATIEGVVDRKSPVATKAEAEDSSEVSANNTKRMTPLRVLQAIKKNMVAATETVVGMMRVGTQSEINGGLLDDVAVTPKKLRWGFSVSLTTNGYVVFPFWMGSPIFQWGTFQFPTSGDSVQSLSFPLAFPVQVFYAGWSVGATSLTYNIGAYISSLSNTGMTLVADKQASESVTVTARWISIGH